MASPTDRVFVDANIPMYAAGAEHPLKGACADILAAAAEGDLAAVTDAEVVQEILHRYTALGERECAVELARLFLGVVPEVLAVGRADIALAIDLHEAHPSLTARDSVHAAVMHHHGIARIVSADRHFDCVVGLQRLDPAVWRAPRKAQ